MMLWLADSGIAAWRPLAMVAGVVVSEIIMNYFAAYVVEAARNVHEQWWKLRIEGGNMGHSTKKKNQAIIIKKRGREVNLGLFVKKKFRRQLFFSFYWLHATKKLLDMDPKITIFWEYNRIGLDTKFDVESCLYRKEEKLRINQNKRRRMKKKKNKKKPKR